MRLIFSDKVSSTTDTFELNDVLQSNCEPDDISDMSESLSVTSDSSMPIDSSDEKNDSKTLVSEQPRLTARNLEKVMKKQLNLKKMPPKKRKMSQNSMQRKRIDMRLCTDKPAVDNPMIIKKPEPTFQLPNVTRPLPIKNINADQYVLHSQNNHLVNHVPTWSSMDKAVGPHGPPNITWLSADPLKSVRAFFSPKQSDSINTVCKPSNALMQPSINKFGDQTPFWDQSDFLAEQATILEGRKECGYKPTVYPFEKMDDYAEVVEKQSSYQTPLSHQREPRDFPPNVREWRATQPPHYATFSSTSYVESRDQQALVDRPTSSNFGAMSYLSNFRYPQ